MVKLYYLAMPYTSTSDKNTELGHVFDCILVANVLLDLGYHIYAPIIMTHWLHGFKKRDYEFWMKEDKIMMEKCDGIILAGAWKKSKGCLREKEYLEAQGKEVLYYSDILNALLINGDI